MALLSWGKPTIYVKNLNETNAIWRAIATPAEDTTNLETTEGDKTEAKIEGGAIEDVMYKKSTFALTYDVRVLKGRKKPFGDEDGLVADEYEVYLQPEDATTFGLHIPKAHVNVTTAYTSADGITQTITMDALETTGNTQIEVGVVTYDASSKTPSIVAIEAESDTNA